MEFENFSLSTVDHNPLTNPTTESEKIEQLKASATTFFNLPTPNSTIWNVSSYSDLKHSYTTSVVGADYKVYQSYQQEDKSWCVEVYFKPTDTGSLTLGYDELDEVAKISWVKTTEGLFIYDFEGYTALIEGAKITEVIPDDSEVVSMSQILRALKKRK